MLSDILSMLGTGIGATILWFNRLLSGDLWVFLFSFIAMALVARFLILPFVGGIISAGVSDSVKSARGLETSKEAQSRRESARAARQVYYRRRNGR